jgi:monofunctional biosynthetic peptidoglycan transglycosylase
MFMLVRHVERLLESKPGPPILYEWVPREEIPVHMALAVVAAEDQNFPRHFGFDLDAIARAVEYNETHERTRGASPSRSKPSRIYSFGRAAAWSAKAWKPA